MYTYNHDGISLGIHALHIHKMYTYMLTKRTHTHAITSHNAVHANTHTHM